MLKTCLSFYSQVKAKGAYEHNNYESEVDDEYDDEKDKDDYEDDDKNDDEKWRQI